MKTFFERNLDASFVDAAMSVIGELNTSFSSHEFIQKFAKQNEAVYVEWLYNAKDSQNGAFQTVHQEMGRRLLNCSKKGLLPIRKIGNVAGVNVFGNPDEIAMWEKIK